MRDLSKILESLLKTTIIKYMYGKQQNGFSKYNFAATATIQIIEKVTTAFEKPFLKQQQIQNLCYHNIASKDSQVSSIFSCETSLQPN